MPQVWCSSWGLGPGWRGGKESLNRPWAGSQADPETQTELQGRWPAEALPTLLLMEESAVFPSCR